MFVEKAGQRLFAHWIEYPVKAGTRTYLTVLNYVPALIPPSKVGMGLLEYHYDLDLAQARDWLASKGYRIVREMDDAPATC